MSKSIEEIRAELAALESPVQDKPADTIAAEWEAYQNRKEIRLTSDPKTLEQYVEHKAFLAKCEAEFQTLLKWAKQ
jgi:hypothetical protein